MPRMVDPIHQRRRFRGKMSGVSERAPESLVGPEKALGFGPAQAKHESDQEWFNSGRSSGCEVQVQSDGYEIR